LISGRHARARSIVDRVVAERSVGGIGSVAFVVPSYGRRIRVGHAPRNPGAGYANLILELKGQPVVSAEEQIERARVEDGGRLVDVDAV
jgi:hypothetical protein